MGLSTEDLVKVPKGMSVRECYERIYNWHKKYGESRLKEKYRRDNAYSRAYLRLLDFLPLPNKASDEDMDFIFGEVISNLMEWSYHEEDDYGIKIAAYAHFALNKKYNNGFHDDKFNKNKRSSKLFVIFGQP